MVAVTDEIRGFVVVVLGEEVRDSRGLVVLDDEARDWRLFAVRVDEVENLSPVALLGTVENRAVTVDALGFVAAVLILLALLRPSFEDTGAVSSTRGLPSPMLSRALLDAVCLTTAGGPSLTLGAGRALKARRFSPSSCSFFMRSSLAALSLAATASPGSWKFAFVGGLVDFAGRGNETDIGRAFERGASAGALTPSSCSFFIRSSLAALSLAATASPGSWKVDLVVGFVDFGGGGGVGKERDIGRGFE